MFTKNPFNKKDEVADLIGNILEADLEEIYFYKLVLNHEEMHSETMHHIRQTFGYPAPNFSINSLATPGFSFSTNFESSDSCKFRAFFAPIWYNRLD